MIEYNDLEQGSLRWLNLRLGKVTGTKLKNVFKSDYLSFIDELIAEVVTEEAPEVFTTPAMQRGVDLEPYIRKTFERVNGIEVEEVGFCISEDKEYLGLSPDGFTKDRKTALEIKAPTTKTHIKYIRRGTIPSEYKYQVLNYFLVNQELEVLYFVSFDDRFKPKPYFQIKVTREELAEDLEQAEEKLAKFWAKYLEIYKKVTQ